MWYYFPGVTSDLGEVSKTEGKEHITDIGHKEYRIYGPQGKPA